LFRGQSKKIQGSEIPQNKQLFLANFNNQTLTLFFQHNIPFFNFLHYWEIVSPGEGADWF